VVIERKHPTLGDEAAREWGSRWMQMRPGCRENVCEENVCEENVCEIETIRGSYRAFTL
jgi:hypothetical protein